MDCMRVLIRRTNSEVQVLAPSILFLFSCETPVIVIVILTLSVRKTETRKEVMKMNEEQEEEYTEEPITFSKTEVKDILHPHTHLMNDMVFLMHGTQPTEMKHHFTDDDVSNALIYMHNEEKSLMTATVAYISNRLDFAIEYKQDQIFMSNHDPSYEMPPFREYLDTNGECMWIAVTDENFKPEPISKEAMTELMADAVSWSEVTHLFAHIIEGEEEE